MPTVLTSSQQTFVDITDQRKLSAYITSNLPKTQSEDPNVLPHTYAPSWANTHLVLTPVVFLDQTSIALGSSGLTITWKRKDGTSAETAVTSGEAVSGGILTVSQNKLSASSSGMITYICYISYYDSETKNTVNISSDITFTLVRNAENAKLAYVNAPTEESASLMYCLLPNSLGSATPSFFAITTALTVFSSYGATTAKTAGAPCTAFLITS